MRPDISVVIPLLNEEKTLPALCDRLVGVLKNLNRHEVIFVDDGSTDKTTGIIEEIIQKNLLQTKLITFSRNFGHQSAVSAGLEHSSGEVVVIMDGDLQDPPEIIPSLIQKWKEGYNIVYAIRTKRKENMIKRLLYSGFYRVLQKMADVDIPLDAGDFSLMDRSVVDAIVRLPEKNRFIRGLRSWTGFSSIGVVYERDERVAGKTKYTLRKLFHLAFDGITGFSTFPLKLSEYIGFSMTILSFFSGISIIILWLTVGIAVPGWTSLVLVLFFLGGIQLFVLGVMGEYVGRIYIEVQNRPVYIIKKKIGFKE
ncbi:MAG: glycosyl transferase [Candidatus Taylorbacteria bacterium RIFCSPLOWO2_12_FULL_43_20]|uniref:Glycosyl transferase n=1 Tax=Candidatus Taylorbacteria bacterium RIFCSPLOWO2_12_FULL_43_20 TaxID=1802332 RepID=A0A1G2P0I2_9BACT|nr:MAG: glycosyl transferase [Candidatus Taylorbacteria bacterium RIFCSPHIGHO2_01_FULL_43_120]OHA22393.1 MAG: glycosyl transferase [Candidatus Taylorbacteria bacterium RIFCSPHIGHO2_02_FULL_43_55]OHA28332.1 MAG: glycosyl transferase [Candidatus Taylorbacteria bacterium RIFCSPHIGHO2_12_FULL_42_34]OHA30606.1 MAG: glycosyl transferase [Candidatus Taylorbacteria bacterium RIFCSPLOWO2_01_FULL_43_83]OHA38503.1 MAG: glycosyl transferase [Candidatus Taylorbacteria bacterium RIFCSPLOWO2_02_FULL_43_22b]O